MSGGKVYLTGGGCGDAGLITWKAIQVLQRCDTVVYDSLVSGELLRWTRPTCEKIYVGKRYGCHSMEQSQINALLIEKAREGRTVVRLKGGDPYVFGRGGEEFMALQAAGVFCEEIPGITSAIAVPAAAGIPVTHRGIADSVTVVTGTAGRKDGCAEPEPGKAGRKDRQAEPGSALEPELKMDFQTLAKLGGTLVILMGMHHLAKIVRGLLAAGKDRHTPCAVIMEGTRDGQRVLRASLSELPDEVTRQGFTSPAVIVIGAVAELSLTAASPANQEETADSRKGTGADRAADDALSGGMERQRGTRVGVTGTAHFVGRVSSALREKGVDVWDMGFMEIIPAEEPLPDFGAGGWLVFTSPNGVRVFLEKMRRERRDLRTLSGYKIAVIGPGTAAALQEAGLYADYMPEIYDSRHLAQGLSDILDSGQPDAAFGRAQDMQSGEKRMPDADRECRKSSGNGERKLRPVMLLRAAQGSAALTEILRKRGIPYTEYPLYELGVQEKKRDAVIAKAPDYIVFGSAMGARAYFERLEQCGIQNTGSRYVCIGEQCAKEVRKYTETQPFVAEKAGADAIAKLLSMM